MKIIGLLFGLYLGSIMSVQAQDLSKDATSIITDSRTEVLCKSMTQSIEKESRTILILNRKGLNAAHFVCECDMFRSLQKFSGEILNASGQSVRKIKKSELQKSEYSSSLSTDDYAYYYECNFPSFPFTVKYEWEIKCNNGLIGYQSFLALSVITMMLTPFLINLAPRAAALLTKGRGKEASSPEEEQQKASTLKDHLIIVGFGISGKHLAQVAKESGIPYTILEMNPETVSRYKNKEPISHGDASQPVILEHLGVYTARVLAIIISDPAAVRAITLEARRMNPDLYIVARTRFITEVAPLRRLGANVVIAEEFETSIEVFNQVLTQYLVPRQDIDAFSARLRQQNYRMIRRMSSAADSLESVASRLPEMGVQTMRLEAGSPLCGLSLAQSNLRREYAVTVVAVARSEQEVMASPPADFVMEAGDLLYLFGKTDKLFAVKPVICAAPATPAAATAQEASRA